MSKVLHSASPEVMDFIKALGIDAKNLTHVDLRIHVGEIVTVTVTYQQEVWISDLKKAQEVIKKYHLIERPSKSISV